jgi:hypothetical protein
MQSRGIPTVKSTILLLVLLLVMVGLARETGIGTVRPSKMFVSVWQKEEGALLLGFAFFLVRRSRSQTCFWIGSDLHGPINMFPAFRLGGSGQSRTKPTGPADGDRSVKVVHAAA